MLSGGITEETIENNEVLKQSGIRASEDYLTETGIKMLSQPSNEVLDSEEVNKTIRSSQPVTPNTIISGKQTIRQGQKGKVVRQIQTMLVTLGYDLGDSGKNKDGVDGDYGDKTVEAIVDFQFDYDLDGLDGVVGKETMTKLYDLYKEKTISKNEE
jgi:peptidoglycan hydrolase-like protein with peptidoglycan-binding domain